MKEAVVLPVKVVLINNLTIHIKLNKMAENKTGHQGQGGKAGGQGASKGGNQKQSGGSSRKSSMNEEERGSSSGRSSSNK
ncbi:MAG: hypothetical protein ACM3P1_11085 [Candidatus Saccharibacteria bacterium]